MMKTNRDEIRVLVFKDDNLYIAQCLEYDIAVQGQSLKELEERFVCTVMAHVISSVENKEIPFSNIPKTPKEFWDMYRKARPFRDPLRIPRAPRKKIEGKNLQDMVPKQACMALL